MKNLIFLTCFILASQLAVSQVQKGTWRTTNGNTDYHHFTRAGGGAAVYINQTSTDTSFPILRLSSGTDVANQHIRFTFEHNGSLGIGTDAPETKLHIQSENVGVKSQLGLATIEGKDAQLDLVSSSADKWGSGINFIEGNGSSNTNMWTIIRQTTNGSGNSNLHFNYGSDNSHANLTRFAISSNGNVGIGTDAPQGALDILSPASGKALRLLGENMDLDFHIGHNGEAYGFYWRYKGTQDNNENDLELWSNNLANADRMIYKIHQDGNVLFQQRLMIGSTSDPVSRLHIASEGFKDFLALDRTQHPDIQTIFYLTPSFDGDKNDQVRLYAGETSLVAFEETGRVGIGTANPDSELTVKGTVHAEEVKVDLSIPGPDYVFEPDYELLTLEETKAYIKQNKHLPEIPSAAEMEVNGIDLGEMNMLLLKKIEELTLHVIEKEEQINDLTKRIEKLEINSQCTHEN